MVREFNHTIIAYVQLAAAMAFISYMPRSKRCPTKLTGSGLCALRWRQ